MTVLSLRLLKFPLPALAIFFFLGVESGLGQQSQIETKGRPEIISLWHDPVPGALGKSEQDTPKMLAYFPSKEISTNTAIVLCEGGSYRFYYAGQGEPFARWLIPWKIPWCRRITASCLQRLC